jgi:hypothetical protein
MIIAAIGVLPFRSRWIMAENALRRHAQIAPPEIMPLARAAFRAVIGILVAAIVPLLLTEPALDAIVQAPS